MNNFVVNLLIFIMLVAISGCSTQPEKTLNQSSSAPNSTNTKAEKLAKEVKQNTKTQIQSSSAPNSTNAKALIAKQKAKPAEEVKHKASIASLDDALQELQGLDKQINDIKTKFIADLKSRILEIAENYSKNYMSNVVLEKDEFETEKEYQDRIATATLDIQKNSKKFQKAMDMIMHTYNVQIMPLLLQMKEVSKQEFLISGHDTLKIKLGKYNPNTESFTITIASINIKRPIHSIGRVEFAGDISRTAKKAGLKKGDIILVYNKIEVTPDINWSKVLQTVIADTTDIIIERDGKIQTIAIPKGVYPATVTDDYLINLDANQYVVNGYLHVPRNEARQFKQNYLNGFITAELKVSAKTPLLSLIRAAVVVNKSNRKQYDLFKSKYLHLGNRLTFDTGEQVIWLTKILKKLNYKGAVKFLSDFSYKGLEEWILPTANQLENLRNPLALWRYSFHKNYMYTSTLGEKTQHHIQYSLSKNNSRAYGDNRHEAVIGLIPWNFQKSDYDLYQKRFIKLTGSLIFDTTMKLIWITTPADKKMTFIEAQTYIKQLVYQGLKGWRLPTAAEFSSFYDHSIPGLASELSGLGSKYFYTNSLKKNGSSHIQSSPSRNNNRAYGDNQHEAVIGVM